MEGDLYSPEFFPFVISARCWLLTEKLSLCSFGLGSKYFAPVFLLPGKLFCWRLRKLLIPISNDIGIDIDTNLQVFVDTVLFICIPDSKPLIGKQSQQN